MATQELQEQPRRNTPESRRGSGSASPGISYDLSASAASAVRRTTGLLRRHKLLIGTVIVLGTGLAAVVAFRMTPLYTAETLIMVEHRKNTVLNFEGVVSDMTPDISALQSEVAILKSPAFAEKVVAKLKLMNDPEFNTALRPPPPGWLAALNPRNWIPDSWKSGGTVPLSPEEVERNQLTSVVNAVLDNTSVRPQGRSYVIAVSFDSEDPRKASLVANTMADLYLVDQLDEKFKASKRATQWLEERLADLRKEAQTTGDAVEKYRTEHGLTTSTNESTVVTQQLSQLNTDYILARTKRQEAEAKLRDVTAMANSPRGASAVGDVLGSPLIQALREREVDLQRQIADATNRYGTKHPMLQALQSQLRDLQSQIKADVAKIIANLSNEVDLAKGREQALKASLDQAETKQNQQQQATVGLRTLERDASTAQSMYEALLTRSQQIAAQTDMRQPDARVVSEAAIPLDPSQPNRKLILLLALVASGTLGVLLAMLRERADGGFRSPHQFELATGVRSLGIVPRIPRLKIENAPSTVLVWIVRSFKSTYWNAA